MNKTYKIPLSYGGPISCPSPRGVKESKENCFFLSKSFQLKISWQITLLQWKTPRGKKSCPIFLKTNVSHYGLDRKLMKIRNYPGIS